ncbi:hypothetical protein FSP39_020315 [Pinctada imbricata]|uniref:DNA-(apurinic or apyrimidinic site) endonuclease n=1 Tax=Pinctada imbricata TaxID=66713 RepID=A0AA89CBB6_PINIB|nr:hypothetical protein FSP39_020315 [Pinctada imbricata]
MKILTWNINGIRTAKGNLKTLLDSLEADVICIQETKVTRDMLDEPTAIVEGYNSYFAFSRKRSGYSGVATFCKDSATPVKAEEGLGSHLCSKNDGIVGYYGDTTEFDDEELESLDAEGRAVITQHKIRKKDGSEGYLAIINVYCPRVDPEREDRHLYKLRFFALLQTRAEALVKSGSHVIVLGDINAKHKKIDHCDPGEDEEFYSQPSRIWFNQFVCEDGRDPNIPPIADKEEFAGTTTHVEGGMFVDCFRHLYPDQKEAYTNWHTLTGARDTNYGCRLDYIFCDNDFIRTDLHDCVIMPEVMGSDHCPVKANFTSGFLKSDKCPSICTKLMPEFSGRQQKLSSFFLKRQEEKTVVKSELKKETVPEKPSSTLVLEKSESSAPRVVHSNSDIKKTREGSRKRPLSQETDSSSSVTSLKKRKSDNNLAKQGSLMNFFGKPKQTVVSTGLTEKAEKDRENLVKQNSSKQEIDKQVDSKASDVVTNGTSQGTKEVNTDQSTKVKTGQSSAWKNLLQGPPPAPLCKGHKEPCVLRTVKKAGPNKGKQFFVCARSEGASDNPEARCDFFKWVEYKKK